MLAQLIEEGDGWCHIIVKVTNVDPKLYLLASFESVVDAGLLSMFAVGETEVSFFESHKLTTLSTPVFVADFSGYNGGNELLGLLVVDTG